jgi:hypothetical protein
LAIRVKFRLERCSFDVLRSLVTEGADDETPDPRGGPATLRPHLSHALERARAVRN